MAEFAFVRVIAVRDGLPGPQVWLVLRRSLTDGELKTYLCNAPATTAQPRLVRTSGMRWPIETCFETGKQELGMGDYELRSWRGWHHHMTLVILALSFLVRLQCRLKKRSSPDLVAGTPAGGECYPAPHGRCRLGVGGAAVLATPQLQCLSFPSQAPDCPSQSIEVKSRCSTSPAHTLAFSAARYIGVR